MRDTSRQSGTTCAVVVSYNRVELLKNLIRSLTNQTVPLDEIIVVDNGSTDGAREFLESLGAPVRLVRAPENGGGAGGFSLGVSEAIEAGHAYAWLMDDDGDPHSDAHEALRSAAERLNAAGSAFSFLSSAVEDPDGRVLETHRPPTTRDAHGNLQIPHGPFVGAYVDLVVAGQTPLPVREFFLLHDDSNTRRVSHGFDPDIWSSSRSSPTPGRPLTRTPPRSSGSTAGTSCGSDALRGCRARQRDLA